MSEYHDDHHPGPAVSINDRNNDQFPKQSSLLLNLCCSMMVNDVIMSVYSSRNSLFAKFLLNLNGHLFG